MPLVRSKGAETGVRAAALPGLQTSVALWQLDLACAPGGAAGDPGVAQGPSIAVVSPISAWVGQVRSNTSRK